MQHKFAGSFNSFPSAHVDDFDSDGILDLQRTRDREDRHIRRCMEHNKRMEKARGELSARQGDGSDKRDVLADVMMDRQGNIKRKQ